MTNMALPKAVQDQLDAAAEIEANIAAEVAGAPAPGNTPAPAAPEVPAVAPVVPAAPQATPEAASVPPVEDDFKTKYLVLRGKYDAEVPRLSQQLRDTAGRLEHLEKAAVQRPEPVVPPVPAKPLVTQQDVDSFGADLMTAVERVAVDVAQRAAGIVEARLREEFSVASTQVGQVAQRVEQSQEEVFWGRVRVDVPDWDAVDVDPRWVAWLGTSPEYSELTYRQLAGAAIEAGNAGKIVKLVETWKKTVTPAPAEPVVPSVPPAPSPQEELARQVAPTASRAVVPAAPAGKVWTQAEYEQAYDPRHVRAIGPEAAAKLQAEADQATAEGRVQWS